MTEIKWTPKNLQDIALWRFMKQNNFSNYQEMWEWSIEDKSDFWGKLWDFCGVRSSVKGRVIEDTEARMQDIQFFPEARLNFAENLLRRRDDSPAIIFQGEDKVQCELSFNQLYDDVSRFAQALRDSGVEEGDRVVGYMPNMPETIIAMLATSSIGAIWSSASPDFGVQGLEDRFGQIEPKIFIGVNGYYYNGKVIDCGSKITEVLTKIPSIEKTILCNYVIEEDQGKLSEVTGTNPIISYDGFVQPYKAEDIEFEQLPFNHPLYIMFSSGTTGAPKCMVHGAGGTLLQQLKEHVFQSDIKRDDKVFYFTTCGWMMWNWLVAGLGVEATVMLYDGSPFYPDGYALFDFAERHDCTFFGTSAKFIDAINKAGLKPKEKFDFNKLRAIASTGSPLVHEAFDYIYKNIKSDIHLASISGGSDIVSCFVLGNPISPVYRGEIQGAGLGMDVDVFDGDGNAVSKGCGELVCKSAFPAMPIGFWNDEDGQKYYKAYFDKFDNIWCHGDWIERTENNGFIIHGRSDATLNPGGVRIGTAEIYRQVEKIPEIKESIVIGQDWDGDVRIVLFVILSEGEVLDDDLIAKVKKSVRSGATPRHVPAKIIAVSDIPRTKSGKITELAVKNIVHNRDIKNVEALANPEALELYKDLEELAS